MNCYQQAGAMQSQLHSHQKGAKTYLKGDVHQQTKRANNNGNSDLLKSIGGKSICYIPIGYSLPSYKLGSLPAQSVNHKRIYAPRQMLDGGFSRSIK